MTLFHVLDPDELEFPFEDPTLFLSMEDARQVEANGRDVRKGYLEVVERWLADVRRSSAEADLEHVLCRTDVPPDRDSSSRSWRAVSGAPPEPMGLSFLHPALLWGLLAAAVPLVVHLFFRRRPKPTAFPAIDFILRARRETERRLRLKKVLLFAARTLLVAAVAAALARPRLEHPEEASAAVARGPAAVALVLDASGSMRYRLPAGMLFERARSDLLAALDGLSGEEPATALVCGGPAAPAAPPPTFDKAAVRRALREAGPSFGHADLSACVAAAVRALVEAETGAGLPKRLVVATDLAASAWRLDAPPPMVQGKGGAERPEVTLLDAARGAALPNLAVSELVAESDPSIGPPRLPGHRHRDLLRWSSRSHLRLRVSGVVTLPFALSGAAKRRSRRANPATSSSSSTPARPPPRSPSAATRRWTPVAR